MMQFAFDEDEPDPMQDVVMVEAQREDETAARKEEEMKRRSKSPEFEGGITLTMQDGRPISRGEVIQRLKRGESPTWTIRHHGVTTQTTNQNVTNKTRTSPAVLLPSPEISERNKEIDGPLDDAVEEEDSRTAGLEIERPRSALHSGDFRQEKDSSTDYHNQHHDIVTPLSTSPPAPWATRIPSYGSRAFFDGPRSLSRTETSSPFSATRSSLLFLPATSPLFHAHSSNPDRPHSPSPSSSPLALSPGTFSAARPIPYQAHQPRRSISIPHTPPHNIPRRPRGFSISNHSPDGSISSSPIHNRAPMVGSYEESILRGRMSATPSRPLNFIAQIGVLGRGKCRPSLRCPRHVSVQFPAVFYSYPSVAAPPRTNGARPMSLLEDQPSPYVGLIDVENTFPAYTKPIKGDEEGAGAPTGGCYRIPQKGQLQIVIKNPNKTAVKLFLVPYDLSDMIPGQKTFIRQRSFSSGADEGLPKSNGSERPTLRYLVHLHICCPSKGRYFLFKSIRVVFANRVPDGKEKLRNEVQFPEPKYSAYNPMRETHHQHLSHFHGPFQAPPVQARHENDINTEKAMSQVMKMEITMRRRSTPIAFKINPGHGPVLGMGLGEMSGLNGRDREIESGESHGLGMSFHQDVNKDRKDDVAMEDEPQLHEKNLPERSPLRLDTFMSKTGTTPDVM